MRPEGAKPRVHLALALAAGIALALAACLLAPRSMPGRVHARPAPAIVVQNPPASAAVIEAQPPAARISREPRATGSMAGALPTATVPAPAPGAAGMVVGIDPETGKLGLPSPAFRDRLSASPALDRSMTGLTVVTRPDGSKHLDLKGRFQEYMVLRLTPDGRKVETCVQGPDVGAALAGGTALHGGAQDSVSPAPSPAPSPEPEVR